MQEEFDDSSNTKREACEKSISSNAIKEKSTSCLYFLLSSWNELNKYFKWLTV
jgi:hypothetical protein